MPKPGRGLGATGPAPAAPSAAPRPVAVPGRGSADDEVDFDRFDLLSRSLPTTGPLLEPEPSDLAMLRPVVWNQSECASVFGAKDDDDDDDHGGDNGEPPTETSPLLRPRRVSDTATPDDGGDDDESSDDEDPPFLNNTSPGRFWFIFSQLLAAQFIGCFDGTIMASSHPVITSYFGAANSASWLSTAFLLTSTAFQPLLGRLSDAVGRKPLFLGCLVVFALATGLVRGRALHRELHCRARLLRPRRRGVHDAGEHHHERPRADRVCLLSSRHSPRLLFFTRSLKCRLTPSTCSMA